MIWPQGLPPSLEVTVGSSCDVVDTSTGGSCAGDNVINLNFAISNSMPWIQTYGLDIRVDNGFDNLQPASTTCGGGSFASGISGSFTSPGIIFTGDTTAEFGQGSSSSTDWVVGGSSYPEEFQDTVPLMTSTQKLRAAAERAGIEPEPLNNLPGCGNPTANCNLPNNLAKGVYYYDGDIHFKQPINNSFQAGNTYVFLAENNHNIYFENNASSVVPLGALVFFAAGGDIVIDKDVHAVNNSCPVPGGQLQGVFSADNDIIVEGNNRNCTLGADKMLNIEGTFIANAMQGSGIFVNNRDLCGDNLTYPSITITARPDFILNIPGFMTEPNIVSQEAL